MNFIRERFRTFSIIDIINLTFLVILTVFYSIAISETPYGVTAGILLAVLYVYLFTFSALRPKEESENRGRQLLMFLYPVILLFALFESFFMILPYFNADRYDAVMAAIDFSLLGVNPTVWIERLIHPAITELLYFAYAFYFPMPLILVGWMFGRRMQPDIARVFFTFFLCYYGAYISYFMIPVQGPRFYFADLQTVPLDGLWLAEKIRNLINIMEPNKLDAFPSLHAAILLLTMLAARRYSKGLYWFYLPIAPLITISLVYLRYHYVIDVLVGFTWAALCWWLGGKIYDKYHRRFAYHFHRGIL